MRLKPGGGRGSRTTDIRRVSWRRFRRRSGRWSIRRRWTCGGGAGFRGTALDAMIDDIQKLRRKNSNFLSDDDHKQLEGAIYSTDALSSSLIERSNSSIRFMMCSNPGA